MSTRAIRALRADLLLAQVHDSDGDSEESEDDHDDDVAAPIRSTFATAAALMEDDESSSSSEDEEEDDEYKEETANGKEKEENPKSIETVEIPEIEESEEDIDELLNEFQEKDSKDKATGKDHEIENDISSNILSKFSIILNEFDSKDLDYDYCMRTSLTSSYAAEGNVKRKKAGKRINNIGNKTFTSANYLFGPPRDGWVRPPHLIGGGMGMKVYNKVDDNKHNRQEYVIPWPYNTLKVLNHPNDSNDINEDEFQKSCRKNWYSFTYSDTYQRDCRDYYSIIQQSGDLNALVMFVAHHPFCCPALLQLSTILYETNRSQEGFACLCRCLYIYESAMLLPFKLQKLNGTVRNEYDDLTIGFPCFLNIDKTDNSVFFSALKKLVQVSYIAGLSRNSLAICRFILSLDPLRDPMGILLIVDRYILASDSIESLQWFIELVDSDIIQIFNEETESERKGFFYKCGLLDLPNLSFSYALSLYKLYIMNDCIDDDLKDKADIAIQSAMSRFPLIVGKLLKQLEVDITGRSFRRDWISVLTFTLDLSKKLEIEWSSSSNYYLGSTNDTLEQNYMDAYTLSAIKQSCEKITKNFVQNCSKFWNDDEILQWMFNNLQNLQKQHSSSESTSTLPKPPNPAIIRYLDFNLSEFDDKIITLPPEVAVIDNNLIEQAMVMNTNRPRFARHMQQQHRNIPIGQENGNHVVPQQRFGGPPTQIIDPDWPIAEVFWRSFLPWNRVEGIPPPERR